MAAETVGSGGVSAAGPSRMERRKAAKKEKRKQKRKELAAKEREEEEARLNDPEELLRIQLEEERERERLERERKEFEEHERVFLEVLEAKRKAEEEEEERRKALEDEDKQNQVGHEDEHSDDDWEYIEEGPPEIIWQGNEIIVKKKKVRVKRKDADLQIKKEDPNRPTSNPLPPQSEAFADYKTGSVVSAQQLLENAAQQIPNFGTEQDKAHCPFHLKTGACRFGSRCSRVHFYPDKSCTFLIKNMYNGPGLAWEQDEGLEVCNEVLV
ncbi:Zinc finger CCCH domain-containing protein [Actinidia chinensis var. chinensis]|uniref:Zinc finger CCCH domain-containing protein n=1 Tax=Actinidia chinensis var. chinensis TaxID=1590841 RepID=A0A2R6R184_ACTCC|nr:Zinc finger CCCH domain-containing protein [Actinidia chinensis var. chinensis]